jgi:hypothetical protein
MLLDFTRCQGYIDGNKRYRGHYGPICELGDSANVGDCRHRDRKKGFNNAACRPKVCVCVYWWYLIDSVDDAILLVYEIIGTVSIWTLVCQGWDASWRVVGYAVDGFRIFASTQMLTSDQVDNCNGRFTLNPTTGKYTVSKNKQVSGLGC